MHKNVVMGAGAAWIRRLEDWLRFGKAKGGAPGGRGAEGERRAERWLRRTLGWRTVARNWRAGRGEIDLVMRAPDGLLVFVEVRGRAAHALVGGYASITPRKRRRLRQTIAAYLRRLPGAPPRWRCDVVEIIWRAGAPPELRHHSNLRF